MVDGDTVFAGYSRQRVAFAYAVRHIFGTVVGPFVSAVFVFPVSQTAGQLFGVEGVGIGVGYLVYKVEYLVGVDVHTQVASLEVEVRTGRAAGVSTQGDGVAHFDDLVGLHQEFGEVTVDVSRPLLWRMMT